MSAKRSGNSSLTSAKKRTVIRGESKVKKSSVGAVLSDGDENSLNLSGGNRIASDSESQRAKGRIKLDVDFYRRATILVITMGLVFGIGVQVGSKTGGTQVDQAITTILDSGAKQIDREILERAAIEGALKASGDEWANYFPKSALEILAEQSSNMFTGIGVWLSKSRGGQVKISSIQEDSPASRSGLSVGDQVLEVNGTDVRGASLTSVIALIRGEVGKRIELMVEREERRILATLSTEKVAVRTVEASQVTDSVALIEIASFSTGTALDVAESLSKLKYKSGVILDLRNNPGGLIEEAVKVAQLFIGNGVIVSYQVNGKEKLFKASNPKPIIAPLIIMINRNTASSAEILAGAFQDRNRGVVVGERSYGKGSVQELVTLDDGSKLELTVALYRTPSGRVIEELGISPDLEVSSSEIGIKALQVLGGLASLTSKK
jgi:carboxyl-terminal processing protease